MAKKPKEVPFDFKQFVEEAFGYCVIAIGKGDFRSQFWGFMQTLAYNRFEEGKKVGYQQAKDEAKAARKRK